METKPTGSSHIINIGKANQTGAYTYACMNVCPRVRACVCSVCVRRALGQGVRDLDIITSKAPT